MRWSMRVARIAGIDLKIHVTFFILLAWIAVSYYRVGDGTALITGLLFVLALFACVVFHELGHALMARRYGITTVDITLLPIGGVARLTKIPREPKQELAIAVAGPLVNVAIALGLYLGLGVLNPVDNPVDVLALQDPAVAVLAKLLVANIWLVLFNLIPAFPMDGGRMLRALLAMRMPHARATQIAAAIGQGIAFVFAFLGLLFNPMLVFIGLFVYLGAVQEAAIAQMLEVTSKVPVSAAMMTEFSVLPADATIEDAARTLLRSAQHEIPVVDRDGRLLGVLTRDDVIASLSQLGLGAAVTSVTRSVPEVNVHTPAEQAFDLMTQTRSPLVVVRDDDGELVGLVTPESMGELLLVHSALQNRARAAREGPTPISPRPRTA